MIPFLILNEAAVMSSKPTILGFSGSHHGSGISSASLSHSESDPDSTESDGTRNGGAVVDTFFSTGLILFSATAGLVSSKASNRLVDPSFRFKSHVVESCFRKTGKNQIAASQRKNLKLGKVDEQHDRPNKKIATGGGRPPTFWFRNERPQKTFLKSTFENILFS